MRSPSTTIRSRRTPWVAGCCGPMLSTMSAVARPPAPMPTVSSRRPSVVVTPSVCRMPRGRPGQRRTSVAPWLAGAAGDVLHGGRGTLVVDLHQHGVLAVREALECGRVDRLGLQRLVDRDAVVVEDPGAVGD